MMKTPSKMNSDKMDKLQNSLSYLSAPCPKNKWAKMALNRSPEFKVVIV